MHDLFRHEAAPYEGASDFAPCCASAAQDGLESDSRVVALVYSHRVSQLRDALDGALDELALIELDEHGRNPTRIAALLQSFHLADDGVPALALVDMTPPTSGPEALAESRLADAALNLPALRPWAMTVLCLYDLGQLDDEGTGALRRSHAAIRGHDTNIDYDPDYAFELLASEIAPPPSDARRLRVAKLDAAQLEAVREFVRAQAYAYGIRPDRVDDLVLAVNEVVTNSMRHGGGQAELAMWFAAGSVVCEARDRGHIGDPLVGRFVPSPSAKGGRGLWLANHLCDLVQVRSSDEHCVVRMSVDR